MPFSNEKLVMSGRLIELYLYERPVPYDYTGLPTNQGRRKASKAAQDIDPAKTSAAYRAKARLKRLCFANAWEWPLLDGKKARPIFITLTFGENITDSKIAHAEFTKAMERLNYNWQEYLPGGLKYVVVPERQKKGRLHYHLLAFNLPYIPLIYDSLNRIWGKGFHKVDAVNGSRQLFGYLSKYMSKDLASGREFNGKRYFASRGLYPPYIYRNGVHIKSVLEMIPPTAVLYEREFEPEKKGRIRTGKIIYRRYLLPSKIELVDVVDAFAPDDATLDVAHDRTSDPDASGRPLNLDN